jgi:NADH-quinone oxidoreductase subunit H
MSAITVGGPLLLLMLGVGAMATWWERKFAARMHSRRGPNIVGPFGLFQPIADALKMMQKEDIVPHSADKVLFNIAPILPLFLVLASAVALPFGGDFDANGKWQSTMMVADLDIGVLWILAIAGLMVFPIWMAGWSSNNKYSLLAGMRGVAQGISYEIPMVMAAMVPVVASGELSVSGIVAYQAENGWAVGWHLFPFLGIPAFLLFFFSSLAEANRIPFDIPEAESELVGGVIVEYTGLKNGIFLLAEYVHTFVASLIAAILFLGGPHMPFLPGQAVLGPFWLLAKTFILFFFIYWIRWSWYRFRSDQLMELCWRWLVPFGLVLVGLTGIAVVLEWT